MFATIISIALTCGFYKLLELLFRFARMVLRHFRTTAHLPQFYGEGSWVVITGASDGIALEMAKELAKLGFNLVLISRTQNKLDVAA